ncbi:MAG: hypothetical protein WAT39_24570 [Planctomycetota bacterium]
MITAAEAARDFLKLLSRVRHAAESFLVVRNGEAMCRIGPVLPSDRATVVDLIDAVERAGSVDDAFADDVERAQRQQPRMPRSS